ncbi:TetR/AcrR family transcriptional regulator [Streptomyces sp. NPDC008001]|uniref:TetR/AcrR family transcriptional regulator n=1 Tax=Streptomyces sp. NPDC008001 TaxID=3364804 RepID=UPI0036E465C0
MWLTGKPAPAPRRGQEQGAGALDRQRIVDATIRLLDAEGMEKFSMRRLAAELGVTAMSVYWYVDNKDDLLEYALDEIISDGIPDPADESADWRDQLRLLVAGYRDTLAAHPWAPALLGRYLNIGPRAMAFSNATVAVMGRSGLPTEHITGALSGVFQFVYGFCTIEGLYKERVRDAGVSEDEYFRNVIGAVTADPAWAEEYSATAEVTETLVKTGSIREMRERDFAFALDMLIAGIEVMRDRTKGAGSA